MPERGLRQRIRQSLRAAFPGALVLGWPSNLWTGAGWPDLLFSEWPLLVGFEVKQGRRSKPTPLQASRHVELRKHHVPVYVVYIPADAVRIIATLKRRLPMAFDPSLLAELDAALSDAPPTIDDQQDTRDTSLLNADVPEPNGTVVDDDEPVFAGGFEEIKLDPNQPAPDIEDLTAAIVANEESAHADVEAVLEAEITQVTVLRTLVIAIHGLTQAVRDLQRDINADKEGELSLVPQTAEAPAPRRRTRRS